GLPAAIAGREDLLRTDRAWFREGDQTPAGGVGKDQTAASCGIDRIKVTLSGGCLLNNQPRVLGQLTRASILVQDIGAVPSGPHSHSDSSVEVHLPGSDTPSGRHR